MTAEEIFNREPEPATTEKPVLRVWERSIPAPCFMPSTGELLAHIKNVLETHSTLTPAEIEGKMATIENAILEKGEKS